MEAPHFRLGEGRKAALGEGGNITHFLWGESEGAVSYPPPVAARA